MSNKRLIAQNCHMTYAVRTGIWILHQLFLLFLLRITERKPEESRIGSSLDILSAQVNVR